MSHIRRNAIAFVGALAISTACVLGTVGPVRAATPNHQIELHNDPAGAQLVAERPR